MAFIHRDQPKTLKLAGFNNLTKCLSFNLYDFAIASTREQRDDYVRRIDEKYSSEKIAAIARGICEIIEADVIDISKTDYDPHGASALVLMSDLKAPSASLASSPASPPAGATGSAVHSHLSKSHICAHTYPDTMSPNGVCTFRVDIDIATCGEITPLKALDFMFNSFESDVVIIDYVVRGFTRDTNGRKVYNDSSFDSIREFIKPEILAEYQTREDLNIPIANIWQTKLLRRDLELEEYFMEPSDIQGGDVEPKIRQLREEMREIYYMHQV